MILKKSQTEAEEADRIIETLLQDNVSSPKFETSVETNNISSVSEERYQLPVRVGKSGKSIDKGDKPWIVGHFSPGVQTDVNHPTGHNGVDLKADEGTPVFPIASGVITQVGTGKISGNYIKVSHEDGKVISYYGHMLKYEGSVGQEVTQKSTIGYVGSTGNAIGRGAHLHFEIKINGKLIDPFSVIGKNVGSLSKKAELIENIEKLANKFYLFSR